MNLRCGSHFLLRILRYVLIKFLTHLWLYFGGWWWRWQWWRWQWWWWEQGIFSYTKSNSISEVRTHHRSYCFGAAGVDLQLWIYFGLLGVEFGHVGVKFRPLGLAVCLWDSILAIREFILGRWESIFSLWKSIFLPLGVDFRIFSILVLRVTYGHLGVDFQTSGGPLEVDSATRFQACRSKIIASGWRFWASVSQFFDSKIHFWYLQVDFEPKSMFILYESILGLWETNIGPQS